MSRVDIQNRAPWLMIAARTYSPRSSKLVDAQIEFRIRKGVRFPSPPPFLVLLPVGGL